MRILISTILLLATTYSISALERSDVIGTWKLVSSTLKIIATGEVINTFGEHPSGWITYGADGRMLSLIVSDNRSKPASITSTTDDQRAELFKTMSSYSGAYYLEGATIHHKVDTSWNEV